MKNYFLFLIFIVCGGLSFGQNTRSISDSVNEVDFTQAQQDSIYNTRDEITVELDGDVTIEDYRIINYERDTLLIDTTLTMLKDYKFNFMRKDDFELMPFHNQGQTFNRLGYDFSSTSYFPKMGMTAKHYNYKEVEDIKYYSVPTPVTELMWRTGMEQGQNLDALLSMNLSRRFNISFGFNGLRSLGKYRETLASHGNFRSTINYNTENEQYFLRAHLASHKIVNEENGGLTEQSIIFFESGDSDYTDRGRLDVNFSDAENKLISRRYHLEHDYKFFKEKDSVSKPSNLRLGHFFTYETKKYNYVQTANDLIGPAFTSDIHDDTGLKTMNNLVFIDILSPLVLGKLRGKANYYSYNHFFDGEVNLEDQTIESELKGNALSVGAEWDATVGSFNLKADLSSIVTGDIEGNNLLAAATYQKDSTFHVRAAISSTSKTPDFNFIHFQSGYIDYNWQNSNFKNEQIRRLSLDFLSQKYFDLSASINQLEHYTYFDSNSTPTQYDETVNYLKVKLFKGISFGKFTLDNTFLYQNVSSGEEVFRVPEFITRNSLYYSNHLFKNKPLYLQTGVTFKYFSEYQMNAYDPVLSEFYLQDENYGGFPLFDVFINARVRTMRLYFKMENLTAAWTGRDYYSAPLHPYRDFIIRFGVVWNFFI